MFEIAAACELPYQFPLIFDALRQFTRLCQRYAFLGLVPFDPGQMPADFQEDEQASGLGEWPQVQAEELNLVNGGLLSVILPVSETFK